MKQNGCVRICGNYCITLNQAINVISAAQSGRFVAALAGGKHFIKLDMSHTHLQFQLDDSKHYYNTKINAHHGLFQYIIQNVCFLHTRVEYLGYIIDNFCLCPAQEKVKAIQEAQTPKNLAVIFRYY